MAGSRGHVLVVDDSEVNLLVAGNKLEEAGYTIETARNGENALELLALEESEEDNRFDAVLLDIMMPGIDGIEVLRRIRTRRSSIRLPVLMATAKDRTKDIVEALSLGANDFITKPLNLAILIARLETHLELMRAHRFLQEAQRSLMAAAKIESVGFLAAGVAHEIRNPLGRIQMSTAGLRPLFEKLPKEDQQVAAGIEKTLRESVEAADQIVKGLMQAAQEQELQLEASDLNRFLERKLAARGDSGDEPGERDAVEVQFLPGELTSPTLIAPIELGQVVDALVMNAIQAVSELKKKKRHVEVETKQFALDSEIFIPGGRSGTRMRQGDIVSAIYIRDNGPGISKRHLESIFDPFFSTRPTGSGRGLGLTIVRKIVELHRGDIHLENRDPPGAGVEATLLLRTEGGGLQNLV